MSQHQISTHTPVNRELDMPLHGPVLVLARLGWVVIVMLALGLFAASLPVRFHQLVMLSAQAEPALRHCSLSAVCVPLQVALAVNVYPVYVLIFPRDAQRGPALRKKTRSRKVDKCGTVSLSAEFLG
jgi:hypothetical protein